MNTNSKAPDLEVLVTRDAKVRRPIIRYHGGKWRLAPWIISHFPKHRFYIEPFGGAASVLLRKPRSFSEVYNDLDGDLVNLLSVLRSPTKRKQLIGQVRLTPFSRAEFELAGNFTEDEIENARRTIIRSFMGFGSAATNRNHSTGFRSRSHRTTSTAGSDWINYPDSLDSIGERLRGVIIERRDAFDLIKYHDSDESLFYVDPPYLHDTRHAGSERCYAHEMDTAGHERLLGMLKRVKGMVVLSGYDHDLYNDCLKGWRKEHRTAAADGRGKRTEVIWVKIPDATDRMRQGAYITHQIRTTKRTKDIETAIDSLTTSGSRVTKSAVAALVGLSREQVSRRYAHLFEGLNP